jgi:pteridine reductase
MKKGTVLITGGAKRIGREIALDLAKKGYTIALHYHSSKDRADEALKAIQTLQPRSQSYRCDFTDLASVEGLIASVYKNHPDLEVLINNASVYEQHTLLDTTKKVLQRDINTHYLAPFLLIREFATYVNNGVVINILDARIRKNSRGNASYFISKKALLALTEIAALELAPNIRVNGIAPGLTLPPADKPAEYAQIYAKGIPLGRINSVADITQAVSTLLSGEYLTGQVMYLDGGKYL